MTVTYSISLFNHECKRLNLFCDEHKRIVTFPRYAWNVLTYEYSTVLYIISCFVKFGQFLEIRYLFLVEFRSWLVELYNFTVF